MIKKNQEFVQKSTTSSYVGLGTVTHQIFQFFLYFSFLNTHNGPDAFLVTYSSSINGIRALQKDMAF